MTVNIPIQTEPVRQGATLTRCKLPGYTARMETGLHFPDLSSWRSWLAQNYTNPDAIWIRCYKKHTGRSSVSYNDAVEEALCWGWIDSLIKRVDDDVYLRKLSPRKQGSNWSTSNRRRVKKLLAEGRMQPAGLARPTPSFAAWPRCRGGR